MNELIYHVYDRGELIAGFPSLCTAVNFCEEWRHTSDIPVDLVDGNTGEVVDTYLNGKWENGNF